MNTENIKEPNLVSEGPETHTPKTESTPLSAKDSKDQLKENLKKTSTEADDFSPLQPPKGSIEDFRATDWDAKKI
ncbi:hypothetical protein G6F56_008837 [Rhizopus delemar]|uniref:Uncharacterized protein n=1 Tax=Rhizopus stolonifer TaxID=4846 RepID=A0A367JI79_RHIST|nr:hypothetical protein G6F56_008837 [Rhizopus delemar]RCH89672.1 hypothetical protein CU098_008855 [Rhizopus stolonifer]